MIHQINIADELHLVPLTIKTFQRHVFIANVFLLFQFHKIGLVGDKVFEKSQFPDFFTEEHFARDTHQLDHVWIYIHNHPGLGIENQNAISGRLKEPAIPEFRSE